MPPRSPRKDDVWERNGIGQHIRICRIDCGHVVWRGVKEPPSEEEVAG